MGHSQVQAVLIFYAWTIVISASSLMFFVFQPYTIGLTFLVVAIIVCTVVTLAPLGRRKSVEAAVQSVPAEAAAEIDIAAFDPLDEAANDRHPDAPVPAAVIELAESLDADARDGQPKEDIR
jgi:UDP-GlcNAc:undecaprenyl-phosphate GlcNAc-1-phosphate transferase